MFKMPPFAERVRRATEIDRRGTHVVNDLAPPDEDGTGPCGWCDHRRDDHGVQYTAVYGHHTWRKPGPIIPLKTRWSGGTR